MSEVMNVPDGWKILTLSEIGEIITGSTPATNLEEYYNGEIPFIGPVDFKGQSRITDTEKTVSNLGLQQSREIPTNTIMTVCIGSTIGKMALSSQTSCTNQQINSLICHSINDYKFIFYNMQQYLLRQLNIGAGLQAVPLVNKSSFSKLVLPCPSAVEEQKSIAKILSTLDQAIEATQKIIAKEKNIKKGLMHDLLTNGIDDKGKIRTPQTHKYKESELGLIPEGWEIKSLADVGQCKNGLTYSPSDITNEDGLLVLRSSNIQNSKLAFDDNVFVRDDIRLNYKVQEGDILVCVRNGSKNLIGKNALITKEAEGMAHGAFMTIFHSENYKYIFQLFQSDMFFQRVEKNLGATINSINNSDLILFEFPFPESKLEQEQIANILTTQDKKIEIEEKNLEKLKKLKKGLMNDLLSGKVRVEV